MWNWAFPQQRRLPVIFLTIGCGSVEEARIIEDRLHRRFEDRHMDQTVSQEWFHVPTTEVVAVARELLSLPDLAP